MGVTTTYNTASKAARHQGHTGKRWFFFRGGSLCGLKGWASVLDDERGWGGRRRAVHLMMTASMRWVYGPVLEMYVKSGNRR